MFPYLCCSISEFLCPFFQQLRVVGIENLIFLVGKNIAQSMCFLVIDLKQLLLVRVWYYHSLSSGYIWHCCLGRCSHCLRKCFVGLSYRFMPKALCSQLIYAIHNPRGPCFFAGYNVSGAGVLISCIFLVFSSIQWRRRKDILRRRTSFRSI